MFWVGLRVPSRTRVSIESSGTLGCSLLFFATSTALHILLATFIQHDHPLILVEYRAVQWMTARPSFDETHIDLLIRPEVSISIIESLSPSGAWGLADDRTELEHLTPADSDAVLRLLSIDGTLLTLWPEAVYKTAIDSTKPPHIQVPRLLPSVPDAG